MTKKSDEYLDITADVCPMTFVRAKLRIERMEAGKILEIRLKGREPLINVPKSMQELGHSILLLAAEDETQPQGPHRLFIRKTE